MIAQLPELLRDRAAPKLSVSQLKQWYWDEQRSVPQIAKVSGVPAQSLYEFMRKHQIPRRSLTDSNYLVHGDKPRFVICRNLTSEQQRLRLAGLMLYWAEGAKGGVTVDLANTDPAIIMIFLRFLREVCGVAESRLRVFLYVYEGQDVDVIRKYWSDLTNIPPAQFLKPYVSRLRVDRARQRVLPYGVVHVRYNDKRLLQQLLTWIRQEAELFSGAGTKAANWA